jgi:hypothetical protein
MAGWKFYLTYNSETIQIAEPVGFDAIEFQTKRLEAHGVDQVFTTELSFTGKAAKFIKAAYVADFINAAIGFEIVSDVKVSGSIYTFSGFLNLSIYEEINACNTKGWKIIVGILEDDFRTNFLSRSDVEIDLLSIKDLDENTLPALTLKTVRTHCQELYLQGRAAPLSEFIEAYNGNAAAYPFYWENSDFKGVFGETFDPSSPVWGTTNVSFQNNTDFERELIVRDLSLKFRLFNPEPSGSIGFDIRVTIFDETHTISSIDILDSHNVSHGVTYDWVYTDSNYSIVLPAGYSFNIAVWPDNNDNWSLTIFDAWLDDNFLNLTEVNSSAYASTTQGLTIESYLRRVIYILTGESDGLLSDVFSESGDGCYWNNLLTVGLYIRNADIVNVAPKMPTTFKKVFSDLSAIFNLGWQFEYSNYTWKIRIEPMEYFYQRILTNSFLKVDSVRQYALFDKLFNNFSLGYSDKWKNIAVSGVFAIHTNREYFVPNKSRSDDQSSSRYENLSDIIAEGYAIEFLRRLQFLRNDSGSSDRPNDYDTFIIWLNRYEVTFAYIEDSGYQLPNESGSISFDPGTTSYGSNFIAESNSAITRLYNIYHTPARVAARWWKYLGMNTYGLPTASAKLFFRSGEYNTTYSSRIAGESEPEECIDIYGAEALSESSNIDPSIFNSGFEDYIFQPKGIEFEAPQSLCDFLIMSNPGTGLIRVQHGDVDVTGFLQIGSNQPVNPKSGLTKLTLYLSNQGVLPNDYNQSDYLPGDYA